MLYRLGSTLALMTAACGSVNATPDAPAAIDARPGDAPVSQARCDPAKPFAAAIHTPGLNSSNDETAFALTRDGLIGIVGRNVGLSPALFASHRGSPTADFSAPDAATVTKAIDDTAGDEYSPSLVADGLIMYFHRQQPGGAIGVLAASRASADAAFDAGATVSVDGKGLDNALSPTISADGQTLYWLDFVDFGKVFAATRGATPTIFTGKRAVSTIAIGGRPVLSADELTLYYADGNATDILVSTRASKTDTFGTGVPVPNVNSTATDAPLELSYDGCVLYLASARPDGLGGTDIWEAHRSL
jgi:hypothetical protein